MDAVDAVQAQIARNMLDSGDWVTARLNGVAYLEKSPLKYWMMAVSYMFFGVHDWAARIPMALFTVLLCWLVTRIGSWAFGGKAGLYAGLVLSTCVGLFLFTLIILLIAAPWHVLATIRNPPDFYFSMRSVPGEYHGFFWFYFLNEHLLRFLNLRYPRDYNTVPRLYFWLFHLLWLFPWSAYLPAVIRLGYRPVHRGGRMLLLAVCWIGFLLVFFTFSST